MSELFSASPILSSAVSRRKFLASSGASFAAAAASGSVSRETVASPVVPHFAPQAKHVVVLYMSGGYSHVDTFDPKPLLTQKHDQTIGSEIAAAVSGQPKSERFLKAPLWKFRPNRECGTEISDLFPHLREVMHEVALIRSMHTDHRDHGEATLQLHTGSTGFATPGLGAWLSYGLGTFNPNLPAHVVISEHRPYNGPQIWDASFLPGVHSGVRIQPGDQPLPNLEPASPLPLQELELGLLERLNRKHLERRRDDRDLASRMKSFQTAKGLQDLAPQVLDLSRESKHTLEQYGSQPGDQTSYAAQCIMARRLIENGVRFVEIIDAVGACADNWDAAHRDVGTHAKYAKRVDQPIAALIRDLKQRGLFDDVLLVFCTEFGRSPWAQDGKGTKSRTHHPSAFSCWLAGGGIRPGVVHGQTDEIGNYVAQDAVHVHDFHATILHVLGLDHTQLTYRYSGRDFRLTDVHGHVVNGVLQNPVS